MNKEGIPVPLNTDIINTLIALETIKATTEESKRKKEIYNQVVKGYLLPLLNTCRDSAYDTWWVSSSKTNRIKEGNIECEIQNNGTIQIIIKELKDIKTHTKPFIETLFGKDIFAGVSLEQRVTECKVKVGDSNEYTEGVTILVSEEELNSFLSSVTTINSEGEAISISNIAQKDDEIKNLEKTIEQETEKIRQQLQSVEEILKGNEIVSTEGKFLTDGINTHARGTTNTAPYATAIKESKKISAGVRKIVEILNKNSKKQTDNFGRAITSIENYNTLSQITAAEKTREDRQKQINEFRKQNARENFSRLAEVSQKYHKQNLQSAIGRLKSADDVLKQYHKFFLPDYAKNIKDNIEVVNCLNNNINIYANLAKYRYDNSLQQRITALKDMTKADETTLNLNNEKDLQKCLSLHLTDTEIKNYNSSLKECKKVTDAISNNSQDELHNMLENAELRLSLEADLKTATKEFALALNQYGRDMGKITTGDRELVNNCLKKWNVVSESKNEELKNLKNNALKIIENLPVEKNNYHNPNINLEGSSLVNEREESKIGMQQPNISKQAVTKQNETNLSTLPLAK